jgi:type I restriction enzyme R subunit
MTNLSNFKFLEEEYSILFNIMQRAEFNLHKDPVTSLFKARQFGEKLTEIIFSEHVLDLPYRNDFHNRLLVLKDEGILPYSIKDLFFSVKGKGNIAVHDNRGSFYDAKIVLSACFKIAAWFYRTYSEEQNDIDNLVFVIPQNINATKELGELDNKYKKLEAELQKLQEERAKANQKLSEEKEALIKSRSTKAIKKLKMTEAETRAFIDEQLRQVGWEVDTETINFKTKKTLPERGKNKAIAEWRTGKGYADYALFIGLELYGIVEAKKYGVDISSDLTQSKRYATDVTTDNDAQLLGSWRNYHVPFLYATNGRPYLKQIETKSGIWFLDVRDKYNNSKCLQGWHSPEGLKQLWEQNIQDANTALQESDYDYLQKVSGLSLRDYQIEAIEAVENVLVNQPEVNRVLLAMATGTGKTRTIIGLCYRLIKSNRFKRILFLVDRRLLAQQAYDNFKDNKVEDINTFEEIYKVKGLKDLIPDIETRLHFATVQSMVKRLFYSETDILPIDTYDCIIVDEAHRGYLMDKEMDEEELDFKNQDDYVSKYRQVLDYFDSFAVGLTATPALHTKEIFNKPIFNYSYRQAVIEGFLTDHEPPYNMATELNQNGILWEKGEKPKAYNKETNTVEELAELEDELKIEIQQFNKMVITKNFNRTVIKELVKEIDPESEEKTLVFAVTNEHADLVVKIFKEEYEAAGISLEDEAIMKITGSVDKNEEWVRRYKNEAFPTIVVTVDLLTTGIDVPKITNLVFLRRVRSRILYEQMLGRATRLCPEIDKTVFRIYDAVRMYEGLEDYTQMKPVTMNPKVTFNQLAEEFDGIKSDERTKQQVEQIIAKFQRKKGYIGEEEKEKFKHLTKGKEPDEFINMLKELPEAEAGKTLQQYNQLWKYLDELKRSPSVQLVSDHEDNYLGTERGYGKGQKPEDYINGFRDYIEENLNKITALGIICNKPTALDRKSLKELKLILDIEGFNARTLNTAWKSAKNEDIAADIIAYIRTFALGSTLVSHEERIKKAMVKVQNLKTDWSKIQQKWLDRFEKQLLQESVLQKEDLDKAPFSQDGGYTKLNKIFRNELDTILITMNEELYNVG